LVDELTAGQQNALLALELGDVVEIKFTPNQIPPAITKYAEIIRIDHNIDLNNHVLSLGFSTLDFALFVLDDAQFGKLDAGNALAF
jgi:poly-gamma-glutamate capsule biosynthesis protein CapA/YwtB (metallophosphatase superfamily)